MADNREEMETMDIELPKELGVYVRARTTQAGHHNKSEYICELIRADQVLWALDEANSIRKHVKWKGNF